MTTVDRETEPGLRAGVLLDLDGTLLDTNHLHALAWWRAFRRHGQIVPMQQVFESIGMGGDKLMECHLGEQRDDVEAAWSEAFHALLDDVTLLPGAREFVRSLAERDITMVLATSAPTEDLERFREILDIDRWITGATSSDDADRSKPDPDIFEVAMERFSLDPARTIAIGDTVWDGEAAMSAGIGFVGVETGGCPGADLVACGALAVYPDVGTAAQDLDRGPFATLLADRAPGRAGRRSGRG